MALILALSITGTPACRANSGGSLVAMTPRVTISNSAQLAAASPVATWQPSGPPQAIAIVVHGITASAHSLGEVAKSLSGDGVLTYGVDLRGHGWWYSRSRIGSVGRKCDYEGSVQDVDALIVRLRAQYPSLPMFLIGESVGAAVILRAAVNQSAAIEGVVLCAPGTRCAHAKASWIAGDLCRALFGHKINLSRYQKAYGTEDKIALKQMEHDASVRTIYSARELLGTIHFIRENGKFAESLPPQMPVLMLQGADDRTIKPTSARKLFAELPCKDKRFVSIPQCGHVLLATPRVKHVVTDSILGFINEQCSRTAMVAGSHEYQ